jgi:hypothetical protein
MPVASTRSDSRVPWWAGYIELQVKLMEIAESWLNELSMRPRRATKDRLSSTLQLIRETRNWNVEYGHSKYNIDPANLKIIEDLTGVEDLNHMELVLPKVADDIVDRLIRMQRDLQRYLDDIDDGEDDEERFRARHTGRSSLRVNTT